MPAWCGTATLYKGLIIFIIFLIIVEYLFGTISDTGHSFIFNTTKLPNQEQHQHSPLLKTLLFKHNLPLISKNITIEILNNTNNNNNINNNNNNNISDINNNNNNNNTKNLINLFVSSTIISEILTDNLNKSVLPLCPEVPPNLQGKVDVIKSPVPTVKELENRFSWLKLGGHWSPDFCQVVRKVAIIIPFRCRGEHLLLFIQHMHPFLKRQQLDYTIFIIEQDKDGPFNRAMLMNIGFKEALKLRNFDCFIFHDIDLLPEDDRNLYSCPMEQPRHMSVAIDIFKYRLPYPGIFGGVSAISREHFQLLNGFSNSFWGWGGEDDDMSNRIRYHNLFISRYPLTIARYTMLTHKKDKPSPNRFDLLKQGQKRFDKDGLNSLKYKLIQSKENLLYTWILVSIDTPS